MQQNFNRAYSNKKSTMQMPTKTPSTKSATTKIQTIFFSGKNDNSKKQPAT